MSEKIYTLRIDEELFEKVRISAELNRRSIAKEIEHILDNNFAEPPKDLFHSPEIDELVKQIIAILHKNNATGFTTKL